MPKLSKPLPKVDEPIKEFRMRGIVYVLKRFGPMCYDDIAAEFNIAYADEYRTSRKKYFRIAKETVIRNIDTLAARESVVWDNDDEDTRRRVWEAA